MLHLVGEQTSSINLVAKSIAKSSAAAPEFTIKSNTQLIDEITSIQAAKKAGVYDSDEEKAQIKLAKDNLKSFQALRGPAASCPATQVKL